MYKEIHAYLNEDGSYSVEMFGSYSKTAEMGHYQVRKDVEARTHIPRASITITVYESDKSDGELLSIQIK